MRLAPQLNFRDDSCVALICADRPMAADGRAGFLIHQGSAMKSAAKPLTPANEPATALEQLHAGRAGLAGELAVLNASSGRLRETAASTAAVLAEIDELGRNEIAEMTKWATEGCHGDAPRSDQQKRIVLGQKLNAAQSAAAAAKGAGQDIDHQIVQRNERMALINDQIEQAIFDQIEREHSDVVAEYAQVCIRGSELATKISGLALLFRETGNNQRAAAIFATKLPMVSTNPREVQSAADAWGRRVAELRNGSSS
jgi:hypothetical protein